MKASIVLLVCAFIVMTMGSAITQTGGQVYSWNVYTMANTTFAGDSLNVEVIDNRTINFTLSGTLNDSINEAGGLYLRLYSNNTENTTVNVSYDGSVVYQDMPVLTYANATRRLNEFFLSNTTLGNLSDGVHTLKIESNIANVTPSYVIAYNTTDSTGTYMWVATAKTVAYNDTGQAQLSLFWVMVIMMIVAVVLLASSRLT